MTCSAYKNVKWASCATLTLYQNSESGKPTNRSERIKFLAVVKIKLTSYHHISMLRGLRKI
jgi:hypothetical protein